MKLLTPGRAVKFRPQRRLREASAEIRRKDLPREAGINLTGPPGVLHFSRRLEVAAWALAPVYDGERLAS